MAIELKRDMMKESENGKGEKGIDFRALNSQMKALEELRDSDIFKADDWRESVGAIIDFQREDGSFSFFSDYHIPSDGRVLYIYRPSYACCQILIRAVVAGRGDAQIEDALERGLAFCCTRGLVGHGFDGLSQQIEDVENFIRCGVLSLAATRPGLAPAFFSLLQDIGAEYARRIRRCDVFSDHGSPLARGIMRVTEAMDYEERLPVFVYGTLMTGMPNAHLVRESGFVGNARIDGYTMYDLGAYPGILPSGRANWTEDVVYGEVRLVDAETLTALDRLEGEGHLYRAERVIASVGSRKIAALAYVYMHDVDDDAEIPTALQPYSKYASVKDDLVWYVCYGSNLLHERFMTYIEGGRCRFNGRTYPGCSDKTPPILSMPTYVPYELYFGNESSSWGSFGTAFLDLEKEADTFGRAYLITRGQYEQIRDMEGRGPNWYCDEVDLGSCAGISMLTFTNKTRREENFPSSEYLDAMRTGLAETYPEFSESALDEYLDSRAW